MAKPKVEVYYITEWERKGETHRHIHKLNPDPEAGETLKHIRGDAIGMAYKLFLSGQGQNAHVLEVRDGVESMYKTLEQIVG